MKVLLDEDLPHRIHLHLTGHEAFTVAYRGWSGLKNGALLRQAEEAGFEVFLTGDRNLVYQQNLVGRQLAIVVLSAQEWPVLRECIGQIAGALALATPGSFQTILCSGSSES